jgi:hypothetical protein
MALSAQCKTLSRWSRALEFASGLCSLHQRSVMYKKAVKEQMKNERKVRVE